MILARWLEWIAVFVVMPTALMMVDDRRLVFGLLWGAAFAGGAWLWRNDRACFSVWPTRRQLGMALLLCLPVALFIFTAAYHLVLERFLSLPRDNPYLFAMIALLYPFLSALPQEVFYRGFFFERYRAIFPDTRVMIVMSSLAFALAHLAFGNVVALGVGFLGGLLFALSYARTRSLPLVVLEHAVYGLIVFASGLGWFFYLGAGHRFGGP